ncbi:hypothetical protein FHS21_003155 [Phyllobacterium trifolii]|uniref:Uncharacterized protein n=1 Tax=Phyllobacterium trifolii TaxID=300193 RepID=A0A839UE93_9HYPH|nr:hypothetical protein [Phyllobacterium trifolii]
MVIDVAKDADTASRRIRSERCTGVPAIKNGGIGNPRLQSDCRTLEQARPGREFHCRCRNHRRHLDQSRGCNGEQAKTIPWPWIPSTSKHLMIEIMHKANATTKAASADACLSRYDLQRFRHHILMTRLLGILVPDETTRARTEFESHGQHRLAENRHWSKRALALVHGDCTERYRYRPDLSHRWRATQRPLALDFSAWSFAVPPRNDERRPGVEATGRGPGWKDIRAPSRNTGLRRRGQIRIPPKKQSN